MSIKFFQEIRTETGIDQSIEKIKVGQEVLVLQPNSAKFPRREKIENVQKELPIHPWKGFRVTFGNSHLFCSGEQSFLTSDYAVVNVNHLKPGQHYLLNESLESVEVKKVENGRVRCGKIGISINRSPKITEKEPIFLLINGVWVADIMHGNPDQNSDITYSDELLFKGNLFMRIRHNVLGLLSKP